MTVSFTLSSSHSTLVKLTCDCSANVSALLSIFVSNDVISSTLFHSSPSVPTSCCFCIPHACVHFFSSIFLASVHHPDFMAHDVSASRNLESELPLGISPPGLFDALDRFHRRHRVHRPSVLIAFCTKNCCSLMLIVNVSSHCLHREVISVGKFCWLASGAEPSLFFKDMSMATLVLLHVACPRLAPSGLVPGLNDKSPQVCVPSDPVLSVTSISRLVLSSPISSTGEMWSRLEKMRPWRLQRAVGIEVGSDPDFRTACLPP